MKTNRIEGFVSIIGGKATTLRAMAEKTADLVCDKTGRKADCRTRDIPLVPIKYFYRSKGSINR